MPVSPEILCNMALSNLGYPEMIGDIYEGTQVARAALQIYGETRDAVMVAKDWMFLRQQASLILLKSSVTVVDGWTSLYPPLPWHYEYAYPDTCLKIRSIRPGQTVLPEYDPQPVVWTEAYDNSIAQKVILTDQPVAQIIFTARVNDPTEWHDPRFLEMFVAVLARRFRGALGDTSRPLPDEQPRQEVSR